MQIKVNNKYLSVNCYFPASQRAPPSRDESSSDEGVADSGKSMVYDFDLMLQKKKEERFVNQAKQFSCCIYCVCKFHLF